MDTRNLSRSELRILNNKRRRNQELKRRISLFCLSLILLTAIFIIFASASSSAKDINEKTLYKYYKSVQVQNGDTLESIVSDNICETKYSEKQLCEEIIFINNLDNDSYLQAGSFIIVPYYDEFRG